MIIKDRRKLMKILVTGRAGFIGSVVIRHIIKNIDNEVLNTDKLTYPGNLESLKQIDKNARYFFSQIDICDHKSSRQYLWIFNIHSVPMIVFFL